MSLVVGEVDATLMKRDGTELATATDPLRVDPTGTTAQPVTDNGGSLTVDNANLDVALSTRASEATVATLLTEAEFEARVGEVQATPTANTILGRLKDIYDSIVARLGVLGQAVMASSTPVAIASDQSDLDVRLKDDLGADVALPEGTATAADRGIFVHAYTSGGNRIRLLADGSGRLVVAPAGVPPPGTTPVEVSVSSTMSGTDDNFYVIPSGETITVDVLDAAGQTDSDGTSISLWWAPNGNTTGIELIRELIQSGNSAEFALGWMAPLPGDGTRAILLRRERLTGGAVRVAAAWRGHY